LSEKDDEMVGRRRRDRQRRERKRTRICRVKEWREGEKREVK